MYSRTYANDLPSVPESYSGIAFREPDPIPEDAPKSIPKSADVKFTTSPAPPDPKLSSAGAEPAVAEPGEKPMGGFFEKLQLGKMFSGMRSFDFSTLSLPKIGMEEILIVGLALFLFFSKDGDKECAVLIALLLLIR